MLIPELFRSCLDPRRRRQLTRHVWIDLAEGPGIEEITVEGPV